MTKCMIFSVSVFALAVVAIPVRAADDCETQIQKLDASKAEGAELLAEKNEAIGACARQYRRNATIQTLVKQCAKYVEQPVIKQQLVAECQIAAFNYANALQTLKTEYRK